MGRESPTDLLAASLVDPFGAPAVFLDQDGIILYHNMAWIDWIAANPTPVFGPSIADLIHPDQAGSFINYLNQMNAPTADSALFRTKHNDLSILLTSVHGNAKWNSGIFGMIMPRPKSDFALEKAQSELADLAALEERWHYVMNSDLHGIWDINFTNMDFYHSSGWLRIRGLGDQDLKNQSLEAMLNRTHPDDRPELLQRVADLDSGKTDTFCSETRERHTNGNWVWILSQGEVLSRSKSGKVERIIGTDTDISHLKELGDQFDDVSHRLDLALTASGIGVWEFNVETKTVSWDKRMYDIYGIDNPQDFKHSDLWEDTLHPDDRDEVIEATQAAVAQRKDFDLNYRIVRPSGEVRYIRSTGRHYICAEGTAKLIGVNWDTTLAEEQARALRDAHAQTEQQNAKLEAAQVEMVHLSRHDALTGLPNRRMLELFCKEARSRRQKNVTRSAMIHIDLDRFKQINDTLGHMAGDAVLCHVADTLQAAATPNSITARVGGDEFVIFIEHAPHDATLSYWALELITKIKRPFHYKGHECRFGISIGIATDDGTNLSEDMLFSNADLALYRAKEEGRGRLRFYTPELKSAALAKRQCADDILVALDEGQFQCVYQPQYDCHTHEIVGAEALVRWDHPTRGRLAPDAFLDIAEELDIVAKIDQAVFEKALADSRQWRASGKSVPQISVNVSAKRLLDPLLSARIAHLAEEHQAFAFELLESVFLDDPDDNLTKNLACIRDLGVAIEVDDFGTGHASMVGLLNLRPDRLKIDRQLILPLVRSQQQRRLVSSIIEIGHVLGIAVVAEGVETKEHASLLASLGCDYLQGYGLAKPMPPESLVALLPDS